MIAATVMVSFVISELMISRTNNQFRSLFNIIVSGILTVYIGVAWLLLGYPIGRAIVSDKVEDTVPYTHPVVIHYIQLTSGVMMGTFFLSFMVAIAAKVEYDHGEKETSSALSFFGFILFVGMFFFIYFYGSYFNTNIEKIAAKYEKGISKQMDNNKNHHPINHHHNDHEMINKLEMELMIHDNNTV
jgi:hypothetical protein